MKQILTPLTIIIATALVVGVCYILGQQLLRNQAIDGCLQASVYRSERTENGFTITTEEPIQSAVDKCLELKQLK